MKLDTVPGVCYTVNMNQETLPETTDQEKVADPTGEQALLSRISHMSGSERVAESKADYLGYRACGFPVRQALSLSDINHSTLTRWRKNDPEFARVETEELPQLQSDVSKDILRLEFTRNMRLAMRTDAKILYKAVQTVDALTTREFKHLQRIRGMYSSSDLMTMTKALSPAGEDPGDFATQIYKLLEARNQDELTVRALEVTVAKGHDDSDEEKPSVIEVESSRV